MLEIEEALNLANMDPEWTYSDSADAWTLSIVTAVTEPEIEDEQGVSVCVPGAYVKGIDTDGDGEADETSGTVTGNLVIDYDASVTSTNGQTYTAATAPVIINTGAAGYSEQSNQTASSTYAADGYINVACGNRGKQSTFEDGTFTGDAPCCLVDQKNATRFVKYNILLGNLPGSVDYFVSTGGSGGGAHAVMLAATGDNPDFYGYEAKVGAVGVYQDSDGNYITSVTIDGKEVALSDSMWGCMAYSAITSLTEADMALAFEYNLDPTYSFNTDFQQQVAKYLSASYLEYINGKAYTAEEAVLGFDLNGDGDMEDTIELVIEESYSDEYSYTGTYVDLYLAEFEQSLNDYLARLDYAEDWTWFNSDGEALSDSEVAAMTSDDRALAFIEGRYAKGSTGSSSGGMEGGPGGDSAGGPPDMSGDSAGGPPDMSGDSAGGPPDMSSDSADAEAADSEDGGHVPSEILGDSLPLYVDIMYGKYVEGATEITKAVATGQTANGTATEATGTDISDWVSYDSENGATFSIEDIAAYRTSGASKAIPGFDVMDYGQEDYVFGSSTADARHWDRYVLDVFEANQTTLEELFNK